MDTEGYLVDFFDTDMVSTPAGDSFCRLLVKGVELEAGDVVEDLLDGFYDYLREELTESIEDWPVIEEERSKWILRKLSTYIGLVLS